MPRSTSAASAFLWAATRARATSSRSASAAPAVGAAASTFAAPVHIHGVPAGALVATAPDGAPVGRVQRSLLQSFAEHASLALADARTLEAMHEASRDPLTGLPNRTLFLDRLAQALRDGQPSRAEPAVLCWGRAHPTRTSVRRDWAKAKHWLYAELGA